jgi:hypothetical protein
MNILRDYILDTRGGLTLFFGPGKVKVEVILDIRFEVVS